MGEATVDDLFAPRVESRQSWTGRNGTYTDHCDDRGELVDYACGYRSLEGSGEVIARRVDCNGGCLDGACPNTCPGFGDTITYLAVDGASATLRNETRHEDYTCDLVSATRFGSLEQCRNSPRVGDQTVIQGLGLFFFDDFGVLCTGTFGNIGLANQCSYRCSKLAREPEPPSGCPQPGDLLTYLELDGRRAFLQDAGSGRILRCRDLGRCDAEAGEEALVARVRGRDDCTGRHIGPLEIVGIEPLGAQTGDAPLTVRRHETCRFLCEISDSAQAPGQPEICEDGAAAVQFHDPGRRETTAGSNGTFLDRCDAAANLVEHRCQTRFEMDPVVDSIREVDRGDVASNLVDCKGHCAAGACPSRCPGFFDEIRFLSPGGEFVRFENEIDGREYDCQLTWDRANDAFDCAADPRIGDTAEIISTSFPQQCTSLLGTFGIALPTDPGREVCAYRCEAPARVDSRDAAR